MIMTEGTLRIAIPRTEVVAVERIFDPVDPEERRSVDVRAHPAVIDPSPLLLQAPRDGRDDAPRTVPQSSTSTPIGQWSEPVTCGQMNASRTRRIAPGEAST